VPFYIALPDEGTGLKNAATELILAPGPTRVEYPPDPTGKRLETTSGSLIVQQPLVDSRPRAWVWSGYPLWYPSYTTLWDNLQGLRSRYRLAQNLLPYVFLKEDETHQLRTLTFTSGVDETYPWLKVRVIEVSRQLRESQTSLPVFENTKLVFTIEDATYNDLG
jgi:hypothetical protein